MDPAEKAQRKQRNSIVGGAIGAGLYVFSRGLQFLDDPPGFANTLGLVGFILAVLGVRSAMRWLGSHTVDRLAIVIPIYLGVLIVAALVILFSVLGDSNVTTVDGLVRVLIENRVLAMLGVVLFVIFVAMLVVLGVKMIRFGRGRGGGIWVAAGALVIGAQVATLAVIGLMVLAVTDGTAGAFSPLESVANFVLAADIVAWAVVGLALYHASQKPPVGVSNQLPSS